MLKRTCLLAIWFLGILLSLANSQPQNQHPPRQERSENAQTNKSNSNAREHTPSILEIECDPACAAKNAKENGNDGHIARLISKAIDDPLTILTGLLAIASFLLVGVVLCQLREARQFSEQQLRAYVSVGPSGLHNVLPTENFDISVVTLNGGQIPAYSVSGCGDLLFVDHPLRENFPFPELPMTRRSKSMVPPHTPFPSHLQATQRFTKNETIEILEGTGGKRLYIFGQVDYIDAFKKPHWTRFCFSFPGWHQAVAFARGDQWDEIAMILNRGYPLSIEVAPQHNVTDDG